MIIKQGNELHATSMEQVPVFHSVQFLKHFPVRYGMMYTVFFLKNWRKVPVYHRCSNKEKRRNCEKNIERHLSQAPYNAGNELVLEKCLNHDKIFDRHRERKRWSHGVEERQVQACDVPYPAHQPKAFHKPGETRY